MVQITTSCRVWKLRYQGGCKEPTSQVDYGQLGRSEYWLINSFRTAKAATDGNHTLCLKSKPQVKCHWSLPAGETSEREAHTRRPTNFRQPTTTTTAWKRLRPRPGCNPPQHTHAKRKLQKQPPRNPSGMQHSPRKYPRALPASSTTHPENQSQN